MGKLHRRQPKGNWHMVYMDASGKRIRKTTGTPHKKLAESILKEAESQALTRRAGILPSVQLTEAVEEYLDYLSNKSPAYIRRTRRRLLAVITKNDWSKPNDITRLGVETAIRKQRTKSGEPLALRTQGHHLGAWKSFTKWLKEVRFCLADDPLTAIKKPRYEHDRKLVRRFLLPEEWQWLKLTPNALIYETAIQTGLRAFELAHLKPSSLGDGFLQLPAKHTKNKQKAKQWITKDLCRRLKGALPFEISARSAEMARHDLAIARWFYANDSMDPDPWFLYPTDQEGNQFDFHALRHTCGAWLSMRGVQPKVIQAVMRHSSIALTLDTYGHLMPGAEKDVVRHFEELF